MTLMDLCEPIFGYVCFLNRTFRKGGSIDFAQANADLRRIFGRVQNQSRTQADLALQYKHVELPLVFFVDSLISRAGWTSPVGGPSLSEQWAAKRLADDPSINELAGEERFFVELDGALRDVSDQASERLLVYYTCIGLGFGGALVHDAKRLQDYQDAIATRIRPYLQGDPSGRICPEAYQNVDTSIIFEPPSRGLVLLAIGAAGLVAVLLCINIFAYKAARSELQSGITSVIQHVKAVPSSVVPPAPPGEKPAAAQKR